MPPAKRRQRLGFFTRLLDQAAPAERYRLATAQILHAEALGFDAVWVRGWPAGALRLPGAGRRANLAHPPDEIAQKIEALREAAAAIYC
jgi:alkanesulfonate monooxygenase SsuD/methylene tetrahydromethanopterin reductase-like flavin-dependent oxidoreductase (luciferase family)